MSQSQIQVQCNNSILFDTGTSTLTLNTNNESKHLAYTGAGTGGILSTHLEANHGSLGSVQKEQPSDPRQ